MPALRALRPAAALLLCASFAPFASGQAIGPDCISSSHSDVARNGTNTAGTITGYSVGSITCNRGDMPMLASPNSTIRPLMCEEMYRLKTFTSPGGGTYQRFESVGQGWTKWIGVPINGSSSTCGTGVCSGGGAGTMGVNCADTYGSGFNGPTGMARRSFINAATGTLSGARGGGTDLSANTNTRLQVLSADVVSQPVGTRFFIESVHLLPHDAQYIRPGQTIAVNAMNNAASQEININGGTSNPTLIGGAANRQIPAIQRWAEIDPAVTLLMVDHNDTPNPGTPGTFIKCRYYVAAKVTDLSGGRYRYEYAVFNLNSDRSASTFALELPPAASFTEFNFRHPPVHSGETISNTPWTADRTGKDLTFATETFAANPNANAIRWGTMYNFGFTTDAPPTTGTASLGLFKPAPVGGVTTIAIPGLPVPLMPAPCTVDFNQDGTLDPDDLADFTGAFFALPPDEKTDFNQDGTINPDDLADYIGAFFAGC